MATRSIELSKRAQTDIRKVARYGALRFGSTQTNNYVHGLWQQFRTLAEFPGVGLVTPSTRYPGCRRFGYGSHLIIYSVEPDRIVIRRVLHAGSDILRHL